MTVNFERINVMYCCFGNSRVTDLYASVFNVLMNVEQAHITIAFNTIFPSEETKMRRSLLEAMARHTTNTLLWIEYPESFSKAQMIENVFEYWEKNNVLRDWYLNIDDDFMIPYKTLNLLTQASMNYITPIYIYGQFDIINYRQFADWDSTKINESDILQFVAKYGMRCLIHHLAETIPDHLITYKLPGASTGSYMINYGSITSIIKNKLKAWKKGVRGYDDYLCNAVLTNNFKDLDISKESVRWIYGSNSYHTDRTQEHIDGVIWTEDVIRDDLMLDGSKQGRPKSKLGEKSLPRITIIDTKIPSAD
jgi:hypothetical protein